MELTEEQAQKITDLCLNGLYTDGDWHKQYYLEQVLIAMGHDPAVLRQQMADDEGVDVEEYEWEPGVPG